MQRLGAELTRHGLTTCQSTFIATKKKFMEKKEGLLPDETFSSPQIWRMQLALLFTYQRLLLSNVTGPTGCRSLEISERDASLYDASPWLQTTLGRLQFSHSFSVCTLDAAARLPGTVPGDLTKLANVKDGVFKPPFTVTSHARGEQIHVKWGEIDFLPFFSVRRTSVGLCSAAEREYNRVFQCTIGAPRCGCPVHLSSCATVVSVPFAAWRPKKWCTTPWIVVAIRFPVTK